VRLRCGVPGRYECIWLLCWSGWRAGTGFLYTWLSFGVCLCDLAGGGGWRGSTTFLVFCALFWRVSTIEMVGGGAVFKFFTFFSLLLIALAGGYAR
jgi:hypothetical protein